MKHHAFIGKQHGGDQRLAFLLFLLFDHAVEAADRIRLQAGHGAALVKDEDHLCQVLFHQKSLPFVSWRGFSTLHTENTGNGRENGRPAGDKFSLCRSPGGAGPDQTGLR